MKFRKNIRFQARKIHRYLGIFIGIQFLFWTIGGLYFSWNNMDDVHGKTLRKEFKTTNVCNISQIESAITNFKKTAIADSIHSFDCIHNGVSTLVCVNYFKENEIKRQLIDLTTQKIKKPLTKNEAIEIVKANLTDTIFRILNVKHITKKDVSTHDEYREKPVPAYAITINDSNKTTFYVSTELGKITSVRNQNWRRFDFLWMLHTMDYKERDSITNWILRVFSVLGLLTIISGFFLFGITSPTLRRVFKKSDK